MKNVPWTLLVAICIAAGSASYGQSIPVPTAGRFYHGCYPGGITGEEDDITVRDVQAYEAIVGQKAAWVYFSNNWYASRKFPLETATWIRAHGAIPFIRLMLRSKDHSKEQPEKQFSLQAIIDGTFDDDLKAWGQSAASFGSQLMAEYGTEVNGDWFGWNGRFHGDGKTDGFGDPAKADGPERFVAAYRHIVDTIRSAGASNITWVFHIDTYESPKDSWNHFENYYPGSNYVQWIGVSDYGAQKPSNDWDESNSFRNQFDSIYDRIVKLAPGMPVLIAEFGCTSGNPHIKAEDWVKPALTDILSSRWPNVRGFSWWNEQWPNDDNPAHNTTMRVQDNAALGNAFRDILKQHAASLAIINDPHSRHPHGQR